MSSAVTRLAGDEALAAIVVAGGRSRRMGRPKPWLDFDGVPLFTRVVERVRPWVDDVLVVAAPDQHLPPLLDGVTVVTDRLPGEGPLPALALGLATMRAPWALALGCDAPAIRADVVAHLARLRNDATDAVIPVWDGRPQPLLAFYRRSLTGALADLVATGERRMQAILSLPRICCVEAEDLRALDPEGESFRSVNTPAEYTAALAAWSRSTQR